MADINAVAQQFTTFYYQTFDSNRSNLAPLYVRLFFIIKKKASTDPIFRLLISPSLALLYGSPKARHVHAHI